VIGAFGKAIEPALRPLGFDWKISVALTVGAGSTELFISSLGTLYGLSQPVNSSTPQHALTAPSKNAKSFAATTPAPLDTP
jgi:ferrous iron transport protein B